MSEEPEEIIEESTGIAESPMADVGHVQLMSETEKTNFVKRIDQAVWMKQIVLKVTNLRHWLLMGDNPYLNEAGCKSVCSFIGMGMKTMSVIETQEKDDKGSYYSFTATVRAEFREREYEDIGYADSRDDFFSGGGKKPQSEIKKGNIKKKAITNAMGRTIRGFLGLDFTREEVEKVCGPLGAATGINYKSKGKPKEELTADDLKVRKEAKGKIWAMCENNADAAKVYLLKLTEWPDQNFKGHDSFDKISMKSLNFKMKTINKHYQAWEDKQKAGEK